jgi:hypothetical protein
MHYILSIHVVTSKIFFLPDILFLGGHRRLVRLHSGKYSKYCGI